MLIYLILGCLCGITTAYDAEKKFTNTWLAEIRGGEAVAESIARDLGFSYDGKALGFEDHYVLTKDDVPKYWEEHSAHLTRNLLQSPKVQWAKQQTLVKRSVDRASTGGLASFYRKTNVAKREVPGTYSTKPMDASFLAETTGVTKHIMLLSKKTSAYANRYYDPLWKKQWYVQDYRTTKMPVMDHNVVPVHSLGYTGDQITVAILDDGVQHNHPDLKLTFEPDYSYDFCKNKPGSVPEKNVVASGWMGLTTNVVSDSHGTSCAGVVAMVDDNNVCGVGIAYRATVIGVRMLCPSATEYTEARALKHELDRVHIYNSAWSPKFSGSSQMCVLDHTVELALIEGTTKGRNGKGAIYVHSAGSGSDQSNVCAGNCFINNPYVIGITSVNQLGKVLEEGESCSAIFATAYSGESGLEGLVSLNADGGCTDSFGGNSAGTPVASGIIALLLEANRALTYRDVMHIIAITAEVAPLADNKSTWKKNGRGLWVSNDFGFGLLNAKNMHMQAIAWYRVPEKSVCTISVTLEDQLYFSTGSKPAEVPLLSDGCQGTNKAVNYLEHIEVAADVVFPDRGDMVVSIVSPSGTKTTLLPLRLNELISNNGLKEWNIMSVHHWGEDPKGKWTLQVHAVNIENTERASGVVLGFTLKMHGTAAEPRHYREKREYAAFRLQDGRTSES